ncbi:pyridoxal-dependent decarboxylase [Spirulina sp. CCNP1310]|uniref:pyridoxal phosphate-dependent decarboxylase family protein n=1 Tax=Spirulina sp. CCNP1310 TaxID=3110249 RepID=UPI002B20DA46|nr:pyridoxal-dependent decarboxylase [Spirulina sp. CCNP1310]MEA5419376.1 pyridoxal-dependent decarboxylase [Spirulina sp. CCNP1310]
MEQPLPQIPAAFIDPRGGNVAEVQALLQEGLDLLLKLMSEATGRSPLPPLELDLKAIATLPADPQTDWLSNLESLCHASMNAAHPGYMGHMDSLPTTVSIIGDLLVAALNNNLLSVEMSPVFSRLEALLLAEVAGLFSLGPQGGGLLTSGGTLANLAALTAARNRAFPDALTKGMMGMGRPVILASELVHTSIHKAAMILGLGTEAVIALKTDERGQVDLNDLQNQLKTARAQGQTPFALVGIAGTTVTGNIDPLGAMGAIAHDHGLWFHIDAAYGGALVFSEAQKHRLEGIEQADSITFNPQKWLYVAKTCAMVLFRAFDRLPEQIQIPAPYMDHAPDCPNLGEISIQGTRHADILKLWLSFQHLGRSAYGALIDRSYDLTGYFLDHIAQRPDLTLATIPDMNILCFRATPAHLPPTAWDDWNRQLQQFLTAQGDFFLSLPRYQGNLWLKAVLLNPYTERSHLDHLFAQIDQFTTQNKKPHS